MCLKILNILYCIKGGTEIPVHQENFFVSGVANGRKFFKPQVGILSDKHYCCYL
jgi:hypothetical protein